MFTWHDLIKCVLGLIAPLYAVALAASLLSSTMSAAGMHKADSPAADASVSAKAGQDQPHRAIRLATRQNPLPD